MGVKTVVNTGKLWIAKIAMTNGNPQLDGGLRLHLFANNITPNRSTVIGGITEIAYPGYNNFLLSGAIDGGIDANFWDTWSWITETFMATSAPGSPVTAYGAYYTDAANAVLIMTDLFSVPYVFTNTGDGFTVTPTISFGSIFNN